MTKKDYCIDGEDLTFLTINGIISGFVEEVIIDEGLIKISDVKISINANALNYSPTTAFVSMKHVISFWRTHG